MIKKINFEKIASICLGLKTADTFGFLFSEELLNEYYVWLFENNSGLNHINTLLNSEVFKNENVIISDFSGYEIVILELHDNKANITNTLIKSVEDICKKNYLYLMPFVNTSVTFNLIHTRIAEIISAYNNDICENKVNNSTMVEPIILKYMLTLFETGNFKKLDCEIDKIVNDIRVKSYQQNSLKSPTSIKRFFFRINNFCYSLRV